MSRSVMKYSICSLKHIVKTKEFEMSITIAISSTSLGDYDCLWLQHWVILDCK